MIPDCKNIAEWISSFSLVQSCEEVGDDYLRLTTPLLYPDGSNVDVFLKIEHDFFKGYHLTDLGQTTGYLADLDVNVQSHARRSRLLGSICRTLDVASFEGELITSLPNEPFPSAAFDTGFSDAVIRLAQACIRTADLSFTKHYKVSSAFREKLGAFLRTTHARVEGDVKMEGRFGKLVKVDFRTAIRGGKKLILAVSPQTPEGAHGASVEVFSKWYDLEKQRREHQFVTVIDNTAADLRESDLQRTGGKFASHTVSSTAVGFSQAGRCVKPFDRHLQAAHGYLELGLPLEANEEIESIVPEMKTLSEVLAVRVEIFRATQKWDGMETVARQLCHQQPDEPQHFISLGLATRRAIGMQEALAVLATVAPRFPTCAVIFYNLACYAAQLGHLDAARARLAEAIQLDAVCVQMALADDDLAPLHRELLDQEKP